MKLVSYINQFAGGLLLTIGLAIYIGLFSSGELKAAQDPLLLVSIRLLHWFAGGLLILLALLCLFRNRLNVSAACTIWTGAIYWIYVAGLHFSNIPNSHSILGSLPETFDLSREIANTLTQCTFGGLLLGGILAFAWARNNQNTEKPYVRTACVHCGGRIAFQENWMLEKIPCPHCQKTTTLVREGLLKMSCHFCKAHIQFPTHAIGAKIPCPHCRQDITLILPHESSLATT